MSSLNNQINKISHDFFKLYPTTSERFLNRLKEDFLTRDENKASHFCVYFLPINKIEKKVFIVHHKKSGLWLFPGGHVDKNEQLLETLNREIKEELGVTNSFLSLPNPFYISVTPIENLVQSCKEHLDIWYAFETNGNNFKVDQTEFFSTKWVSICEAKKILTDPPNLEALNKVINLT